MGKAELLFIRLGLKLLNAALAFFELTLFPFAQKKPAKILIFKVGNIGDTVCAIPSLLAIRKRFADAHITFLSSPGKRGAPGATELLHGSDLFDELIVYYSEDISSASLKKQFINRLRAAKFDLFIQLPEDLAKFRPTLRNIFFAKLIGSRSAFGFRINSSQIFKKAQVDNLVAPQETERLLNLLKDHGIVLDKVEFPLPVKKEHEDKIAGLINSKLGGFDRYPIIAINPGSKREANRWPIQRYNELALLLHRKYSARIITLGSGAEFKMGEEVLRGVPSLAAFNACGALSLLEIAALLKRASLLLSNSTGTIHIGAATGTPCVGFYTVRDIPGKWSPYGKNHRVLYHLNLACDYKNEECIRRSIELITLGEAEMACEQLLKV